MAGAKVVEFSRQECEALRKVSNGCDLFSLKLFKALTGKQTGNVFVSPLSVQVALALAYTGAKGATATELAALLALPEAIDTTYLGYNGILKILAHPTLNMANRMFVDAKSPIKPEFQQSAEKYFLSPAESIDFTADPEKARVHINGWVEEQTKKAINNLLVEGAVTPETKLMLVNAVHFKGDWVDQFKEEDTKKEPFYTSKTEKKEVEMMHAKKFFRFRHDEELGAKILELPYKAHEFLMFIILPDEIDGLAKVEAELENLNIIERTCYMDQPPINIALPKFRLEETMNLNEVLTSLGAGTMFTSQADFKGLSDAALQVSSVVQKSFITVNETGTEASAAADVAVLMTSPAEPPKEEEFIADHPFIFIIMFGPMPLFFGRYTST